MKRIVYLTASILLASGPAFATESGKPDSHGHAHHAHGEPEGLKLNKGKKWESDASLRQGMERIRSAIAPLAAKIHHGDVPAESYASLAKETGAATDFIFKNCKLKPEADAVLHVLLARILEGRSGMANAGAREKLDGARQVLAVLEDYPRYFRHPGWKRPAH